MLKKAWVRVVFVILLVWLIVSIYFYLQHRITIWSYQVNQQIELNDVKINIEQISVRNYKRNDRGENADLIYRIAQNLPKQLCPAFLKICYFYSKPYNFNNKFGVMSVNGQFISNSFAGDERNIEVEVVDDIGVHYSWSRGWGNDSGGDIIDFMTKGDYFPFAKLGSTLKIYINDKRETSPIEIIVNPTFIKHTYEIFDKRPKEF